MPATYDKIATTTLGSAQTTITFSSIVNTYTDLILVVNNIIASGTTNDLQLRFNNDSGSNYSNTFVLGDNSGVISGRGTNFTFCDCGYLIGNSGNPNTRIIQIQNYSNTTTNKTLLSRGSGVNGGQSIAYVNLWRNTSAINTITIFSSAGLTYAVGSTFTLYGIKAA